MRISLKTDAKEITIGIMSSTRSMINSRMHLVAQDIRRDLQSMMDSILTNSPEYKSLAGGTLMAEFGIDNPEVALRDILAVVRNSMDISVVPVMTVGNLLRGGINIVMFKDGIQELLNLSSARYQGKLFEVPWLEWLLTQGDRIIIAGYHITYNLSPAQRRASKSGVAIMEAGGGWRVPPQFSGTEESNWITRAFSPAVVKSHIDKIVEKHMRRRI